MAVTRQPMQAVRGALLTLALLGFGGALAGCESMENFQFWDTKKKLPGDRKPVFPEGVPGIEQGIPPELMKGYQEPQQPTADPAVQAAQETADKAETKKAEAKPKPKPKPRQVAQPAAQQAPQPQQTQQAPPQQGWPGGTPPQAQQQNGGWPSR
jgi:hypothetical protein